MELLERGGPLAALGDARAEAAAGRGSVVQVSGEPGIGKTALVTRFIHGIGDDARVLWGTCDDLSIPPPFGPLRGLKGITSSGLGDALATGAPAHEIHQHLLTELDTAPVPTVLVLEDVHWADQATVDAITVIGRRIGRYPAVLVVTFRGGEVAPDHPLQAALAAIRSDTSLYLQLAPLSREAVTALAGEDADSVYAATGGNPFYVTEMIAALPGQLPPSVTNAVLGRASRLPERSRRLVELVSMVPTRIPTAVLDVVMPDWAAAAEEPERRQLLTVEPHQVRFRHELARAAVRSSVPVAGRRRLHAEVLRALLELGADPADIVHHAEQAGDVEAVADHAMVAARRAAAAESNREAYAHYVRAAEFADRLDPGEQAALFEELALAAYTLDRMPEALSAIERAIQLNRQTGDTGAVGRCTRILSRCHWYAGDGPAAAEAAEAAVRLLEPIGDSAELARAYSGLSQLSMLAGREDETIDWGRKALDLADRLGDVAVKAHALVNIGSMRMQADPGDTAALVEAHRLADTAGDRHEAVRALLNLGYSAMQWAEPEPAWAYTNEAIAYAEEHQVYALLTYAQTLAAWLHLREGEWEEAELIARRTVASGAGVVKLLADTVLTELAVCRGDADAASRLDLLAEQADRTGELQRIGPVLQLQTVWALTAGADPPRARFEWARSLTRAESAGWTVSSVAAWAAVAGIEIPFQGEAPAAHAAMVGGDWGGAAEAFARLGWRHDQALMLSLLDREEAWVEALEIARGLGAAPLVTRVAERMRTAGMTVPRGRHQGTIANPAGLTPRQAEVLELLREGLTNAEIAERLYVSNRTAEHHVAAVLTKLGVSSRHDAVRRSAELGLANGRS